MKSLVRVSHRVLELLVRASHDPFVALVGAADEMCVPLVGLAALSVGPFAIGVGPFAVSLGPFAVCVSLLPICIGLFAVSLGLPAVGLGSRLGLLPLSARLEPQIPELFQDPPQRGIDVAVRLGRHGHTVAGPRWPVNVSFPIRKRRVGGILGVSFITCAGRLYAQAGRQGA